jgi:Phosphate-induced protein 1 conserved region
MSVSSNSLARFASSITLLAASATLVPTGSLLAQELRPFTGEHEVHVMPPPSKAAALKALPAISSMPLTYHGGPVMTSAKTYAIFWLPANLQNGAATSLSTHYQNVQTSFLSLYPGHGLANNNTQYYERSSVGPFHFTSYIQNAGSFAGAYVDTNPYPASGCYYPVTGSNCLNDAQLQAEIQRVITLKGWTPDINTMFFLYTSSGEGSCAGSSCSYTDYCAYHSYFLSSGAPVIYANMPYADTNYCQVSGTPSPNGDPAADAAAAVVSHELTEAITDPELNAWYGQDLSDEIGDKCAWNYGTNTWDSGKANQSWPVSLGNLIIGAGPIYNFELQQEWDQHANACVQVGP